MRATMTVFLACLLGCGCAGTPPPPAGERAARGADSTESIELVEERSSDAVVCRYETMTGSHRKQRICRSVAQREAERESGKDAMRQIQRNGARPRP